jgi:hypothetical protein
MTTAAHGSRARYAAGCRCHPCTRANADYQHTTRRRVNPPIMGGPANKPGPGRWTDLAACRGHNPNLFFPTRARANGATKTVAPFCDGCPVRAECLHYSTVPPLEVNGMWGGYGVRRRRAIHRHLNSGDRAALVETLNGDEMLATRLIRLYATSTTNGDTPS